MAIPSGSGSEVLRNATISANNATTAKLDFGGTSGTGSVRTSGNTAGVVAVPTDVIITVLNITVHGRTGTGVIQADINWQGSTDIRIFNEQSLAPNQTYVYSDKIVLREGDGFKFYNAAASCDWSVYFIYQDWT
tara:strand:+ start:2894 stop:3295 length:402 start_codon:yes stop_codon:yes gene_type:complete